MNAQISIGNCKVFSALLVFVTICCFLTACQNTPEIPTEETTPNITSVPTVALTVAPSPTVQISPESTIKKKALNPIVFLAALIEQYEDDNRYARLSKIIPIFDQFGLDTSILEHYQSIQVGDYDPGVYFSEEDLHVQVLPGLDGDIVSYTLLRLDVEGKGLALIFARESAVVEWLFVDWFPCAVAGFTDDEVSFVQVWDTSKQYDYNWFLRVRGRRDHGTERQSIQTDWYDLTGKRYTLGYMSEMIAMRGDKDYWLGHIITSSDSVELKDGHTTIAVEYSGMLVDKNDIYDWNDIKSVAFYAQDWQIEYICDDNGSFIINDEQDQERMWPICLDNPDFNMYESISTKDLFTIFPDMQKTVEENGTKAQKKAFTKLLTSVKDN